MEIMEDISPFSGPLVPLVWTFANVCPGFQSHGGFPRLQASLPARKRFLRFTSDATPAKPLGGQDGD